MEACVKVSSKMVVLGLTTLLAACGENAMSPNGSSAVTPDVAGGGVTAALSPYDTTRFSMTIDAYRPTSITLGDGNNIYFPAHAVCDPRTTVYGPGNWDKPCTALT